MKDVFCTDQFNNLHIRSARAGTVTVGPCCNTRGQDVNPSKFDFNTNPLLLSIRQATEQNQRHPMCDGCWNHEDAGGLSRRLNGRSDTADYHGVVLEKLDYTTQNICNLACIHCSSYSSSLWAKLNNDGLADDVSYQDKIAMLDRVDITGIRHVHFTGGEPLMTREHVRVLNLVRDAGRLSEVTTSYNTNATMLPDAEVLELWQPMRRVNLILSIDAVGLAAELVRWPCVWNEVDQVVCKMVELKDQYNNIVITFNVSVASYNFLELADIASWATRRAPGCFINWQLVNQHWMHPRTLPRSAWPAALAVLDSHPGLQEWKRSFADGEQEVDIKQTVQWLDHLDHQRDTNWRTALRLADYI
jgi:organic radical activating enzyme